MSCLNWLDNEIKKSLPHGLLLDGECERIYQISKGRNLAVDLGTYCGLSAAILSHACNRVYTFDVFEIIKGMSDYDTAQYKNLYLKTGHSYEKIKLSLEKYKNVTVTQKETVAAGMEWQNGTVDVLFVDADHSEDRTILNVEAWYPHLVIGSVILFHDNNDIHPEVQSAIRNLSGDGRFKFFDPGYGSYSLAACEVIK